ncbi:MULTISPECIES: sodium-dependent transporter [Sphaerochaeta]|jgi:NSS family neurotransmitter:Na+ symporter|nr:MULTISPECIES: sodium-dependent transporter [Sphaerochaeta]MDD2395682.1 sodium-dependent transporter [Sphaerochaeta sp.]MDD3423230.1 sodium-dependent transporter [Sphaerochaeta sp.]MDD3455538.1 sodium-dependent transporter [Sphaerochaeta sp.]MDD4037263.1 sodium-dependent transporter [Sphaerochaeta sp.]MDD4449175.1 sodium-dependent transporter [Sphaerochaeta sp.]
MKETKARETLASRLGFILLSAGCAIGLGNVWRFPFITGRYGGAAFVLIYILFLIILGLPVMVMELAIGRASKKNIGLALDTLTPAKKPWHVYGKLAIIGNYTLMMFYTTITGWLLSYLLHMAKGDFSGLDAAGVGAFFGGMLENPVSMTMWMIIAVILGFLPVARGLQSGVEKITKYMMIGLLGLMLILAGNSILLKGGAEGLKFYLIPDFSKLSGNFFEAVYAAMGQAFFTLSLGIGSIAIFGSYIDKKHRLTGEAVRIISLDTFVALCSGLIIFPAAFAFGVQPDAGPSLIFITLPNIFNQMAGGRFWGTLFFLFMSFAALSTLIAVFENIISFWIDTKGVSRKKATLINVLAISLLSIPCVLGFNILSGFQPLGPGTGVLDLEDFVVSSTLLPLGSLIFTLYCTWKYGWGWDKFIDEADSGDGLKFPSALRFYFQYILPAIILGIFIKGYWDIFVK